VYSAIHLLIAKAQLQHMYGKMHLTWYIHPRNSHSSCHDGPTAVWCTTERPGKVIPVRKTFSVLDVHCLSWCDYWSPYQATRTLGKIRETAYGKLWMSALFICGVSRSKDKPCACHQRGNVFRTRENGWSCVSLCLLSSRLSSPPPC